eukprot:gnl/TRDRNA2_/TRDRNA2_182136_c0_seq1.p1 gnl/TRDRNA2_/TRDRNA2_182136_c0~~gnl/TRDRNA2_/TRDRNA2_182136_c0_seq1.p1  ORF type:complete len:456 (+),score=128.64 gnl/TRDRNA2_/TRDRNA2_182136_c0_seq1:60-1370(+)
MPPAGKGGQPRFSNETTSGLMQYDLARAVKVASRFPDGHAQKAARLEFVEHLILSGADPSKQMELDEIGTFGTVLQKAMDYGDEATIKVVKEAMQRASQKGPIIISQDLDAYREEDQTKYLPVAILFPGQGSQVMGMLKDVKDLEPCKKLIDKATEILGYDILDLCLNGPEEKLEQTRYCQPALFLASACALEKLRLENPDVVERCQATAGLELGEMNAVCFAGVTSFEDSMRMVRVRAEAMQEDAKSCKQAQISVAGLDLGTLERLAKECSAKAGTNEKGKPEFVQVANHLFPKGYSCSGTERAVMMLKEAADKEGALQARVLKTAGAHHTKLMETAGFKLGKALRAVVTYQNFPNKDVYMNIRGTAQRTGTDPREINMDLSAQVYNPVMWQQCIEEMTKAGIKEFYECGPMKQLKAMMKRINQDAWENTKSIQV